MDLTLASPPLSYVDALRGGVTARDASRLGDQQLFASVLARAREDSVGNTSEQARKAAEDFVAQALVEPILKQMREMSYAEAPFAPNQAEKAFRTMLDSAMAQRVVKSGHWTLVDKVTERIMGGTAQPATPTQPAPNFNAVMPPSTRVTTGQEVTP